MSNVVIAIPLFMLMIIVALLPLLIGVYVYRDAKRRGMNAALWTLIAILAPSLIGFIIYLLVRGNYSNLKCPRCAATVTEQYVVCPKCGAKLKPSCPNCSAPVEPDWTVCPKCAQPLPTVQEDIVTPVQPKDKTLWKILAAIIIVPVVLLLVLGLSFSAASGGGSSSLREVSFDEYYADQELPESTKEYVRNWLGEINPRTDHVYALRYTYRFNPNSETTDYYYLIYVPGGGDVDRRGFGYSTGLFSTAFKLELEGTNDQDGLYCVMTTSKKAAPQLRVTLNGKRLEDEITVVDFNPTLYTIASESDYSMLTNAAGDLYLEQLEKEMEPDLVAITVVEDGQGVATGEFDAPDFLLNTVTGIHELHYLEEYPFSLENFQLSDYFTLSVHYADTEQLQAEDVPYDVDKPWNKNMVARILEDDRYIGEKYFPALIPTEQFHAAQERRKEMRPEYKQTPAQKELRKLCGGIVPDSVARRVLKILNQVVDDPQLIKIESSGVPTTEDIRQRRLELDKLLQTPPVDEEIARQKAMELAVLTLVSVEMEEYEARRLRSIFGKQAKMRELDANLLRQNVRKITYGSKTVKVLLKNNQVLEECDDA